MYTLPLFLGNLRGTEWVVILIIILLLFGGKKIPELMRGLGKGVHAFKKGVSEAKEEMNKPLEDEKPAAKPESKETSEPKDKA